MGSVWDKSNTRQNMPPIQWLKLKWELEIFPTLLLRNVFKECLCSASFKFHFTDEYNVPQCSAWYHISKLTNGWKYSKYCKILEKYLMTHSNFLKLYSLEGNSLNFYCWVRDFCLLGRQKNTLRDFQIQLNFLISLSSALHLSVLIVKSVVPAHM